VSIGQYKRFSGFSLIELIVVIVLLGILSVFAIGRLSSPDQFAARGFFDDTVNAMRFAQKLAVSTGCDVQVSITGAGYQLRRSSGCIADDFSNVVAHPANRSNPYENLLTGFTISPATSVVFNARGTTDSGNTIGYTVTGGGVVYTVTVFGQTGLINVP
jgi:MSHA pilin protein MshC